MNKELEQIISQFSENQRKDYEQMHPLAKREYERRLLTKGCPPVDVPKLYLAESYYCHEIYNPDKPIITLEEAMETGQEQNPQSMFSKKEELEEKDLPKGFRLWKNIGNIKND